MTQNNQLQKTESNFGIVPIKNEPLLHYPDLKDTDILKSNLVSESDKKVLIATLNNPKIRSLDITRGEFGSPNSEFYNVLVDTIGLAIWTMGITEKSMTEHEQKVFISVLRDAPQNSTGFRAPPHRPAAYWRPATRRIPQQQALASYPQISRPPQRTKHGSPLGFFPHSRAGMRQYFGRIACR